MKFLIIGGSGVIGTKLIKYLLNLGIDVEFTYLKNNAIFDKGQKLDITQKIPTIELISSINPDVVIHTAALTNVDMCETNHVLADTINVEGTANVLEGCKSTKSKIVYISTSSVFDGRKDCYFEEDEVSPTTYYGITKYKGEVLTRNSGLDYLIVRTDQPYCWIENWQHTNSVLRVIQTIQSGKTHREVQDWYNVPTYVPDFVNSVYTLLSQNKKGVYHLVGSDYIDRYSWSLITAEVFRLRKNMIEPIKSTELNLPVKRNNVNLSNKKIFKETGIRMKGVREGLIDMYHNPP